jgi:hypothetical protein
MLHKSDESMTILFVVQIVYFVVEQNSIIIKIVKSKINLKKSFAFF